MVYLWYGRSGQVLRTSKTLDVAVSGAAGHLEIPDGVAKDVEKTMDVCLVVDRQLTLDGAPVVLTLDVPSVVTSSQAKRAMIYSNLYEAIEAYVLAVEDYPLGLVYRIVWDAPFWYRDSQELGTLAAEIGLTTEQVDDLFRLAATL